MAITDFESTIKTFLEQTIKESYPELSIGDGSPITDLFSNPLVALLKPILSTISRTDYMQDLTNAGTMTEDELDKIGVNNYGVTRNAGSRASGSVYVEVNPEYVGTLPFVIGPLVVSKGDGLQYASSESTIIRVTAGDVISEEGVIVPGIAADYLNVNTGKYEFPVYVIAAEAGVAYNAAVGEVSTLVSRYPLLSGVITNKAEFTDGTDTESNAEYLERIKESQMYKAYGTHAGYKNYVMKTFPEVQDVYVSGFGDAPMLRDKIVFKYGGRMVERSIGGKVDLYIRGSHSTNYEQKFYFKSNKIRLYNPALVADNAIIAENITNPSNNDLQVSIVYETPSTKTGWCEATVIAGLSGVLPAVGDEIRFSYISYIDETLTDTYKYEETLFYNDSKIKVFMTPFKVLTNIKNETTGKDIPLSGAYITSSLYPIIETSLCPDQTGVAANAIKLHPGVAVYISNYYKDKTITLYSGVGAGQTRTCTAYDPETNICTVNSNWTTPPTSATKYLIRDNVNLCKDSARDVVIVSLNESHQSGTPAVNSFTQGDLITITHTCNALVNDVQYDLDVTENRAITTDVLAREATPVYVYLGIKVKCKRNKTIDIAEKSLIASVFQSVLADTGFDSSLQLTDILSILNANEQIAEVVDYFIVPPVFFRSSSSGLYTEEQLLALTGSDYCKSEISFSNQEYPELGLIAIQKVD